MILVSAMRHENLAVSLDALQQLVSSSLGPLGEPMTPPMSMSHGHTSAIISSS